MQHCSKAGFKSFRQHPDNTGSFPTPENYKKIHLFVIYGDYPGICHLNPEMNFQMY
jgi:hypothetical protein